MFRVSAGFYAALAVAMVFGWPYALFDALPGQPAFVVLLWGVDAALAALTWHYTSSREIGFFSGLGVIASTMMSGCANLSLLYVPFLLVAVSALAAVHALIGIVKGRAYTQRRWVDIVRWFTYLRRSNY